MRFVFTEVQNKVQNGMRMECTGKIGLFPQYGNILEILQKKVVKSTFHSFVQFHTMENASVVWEYSRNILEVKLPCRGRGPGFFPVMQNG